MTVRQTGKYGYVVLNDQKVKRTTNWTYGDSESTTSTAYTGTNARSIVTPVAKQGAGSFSLNGIAPDLFIGERAELSLWKGKWYQNGGFTIEQAFIDGIQFQGDLASRQVNSSYSFTPYVDEANDPPTEWEATQAVDGYNAQTPGFVDTPMVLDEQYGILMFRPATADEIANNPTNHDCFALAGSAGLWHVAEVCVQSLQVSLNATPATVVDSCTRNWVSSIGISRISGQCQAQINESNLETTALETCYRYAFLFNCNVGLDDVPADLAAALWPTTPPSSGTSKDPSYLQGKFYLIQDIWFTNTRGPINCDILNGDVISYSISGQMTVKCGCDSTTPITVSSAVGSGSTVTLTLSSPIDTLTKDMVELNPSMNATVNSVSGSGANWTLTLSAPIVATNNNELVLYAQPIANDTITITA